MYPIFLSSKLPLGNNIETYFVEEEAINIQFEFRRELHILSRTISTRNSSLQIKYDNLSPNHIPNSVEPIPFLPKSITEDGTLPQFDRANLPNMYGMGMGGPSVPLMTLPLCMQFARNMGGKSHIGRRLSANLFSKAIGGMGMDRVNVPMTVIDRKQFAMSRYNYNRNQRSVYNAMCDGFY
ncbi:hypothetical protein LSH36_46g04052 [Paralvinella palmiformis]|uniref:Lipoxygenase domain-containing protein n=1 Tax=Paralvinella palmiformis TaxID=53620 RepID=A0AAD9K6C8_9ANNE|nr:hypothetical protein LSH36_46g04052 [Paralvinella palmiformis]